MAHPPKQRKVIDIKAVGDAEGKVYPRSVDGPFTRWRWVFVWLTQLVFYGLCWIPWDGRQAVLFDLDARKFYLFDLVLWPQDTIYLVMLMIVGALALFLFTAVAGRLWCGYSCPQTVYTEIFLWIEKRIEGERPQRIKLDGQPWSARKLAIKGAKHLAWGVFALWTGITFVGYFVPIRELVGDLLAFSAGPWASFWAVFYAFATYGNAGFLRDQMCRQICPYARFQFVMLDPDTLIIAYDKERGDARGARPKGVDPQTLGLGDCVDCGICVQVCPTGIDIRNGLQNECIGCAACIDACDQVMDKMNYPRGLISYTTEHNLSGQKTHLVRPRLIGYAIALCIMIGLLITAIFLRPLVGFDVSKDRVLYRENAEGRIENVYSLKVMNKDQKDHTYVLSAKGMDGLILEGKKEISVAAGDIFTMPVELSIDPEKLPSTTNEISFTIQSVDDPSISKESASRFIGPRVR